MVTIQSQNFGVPIGWALADAIGIGYYLKKKQ